MERAEEDLATSPARWKRLPSSRQIDCGVVVIPFAKPWKSWEEIFFIISGAVRVVAPSQTCLCVEFASFPCVDLSKGPNSNMANPYADPTSRVMQFSFCLARSCSPTEAKHF